MSDVQKPTILIVEDDPRLVSIYKEWLGEKVEVLTASSLAQAHEVFNEHGKRIHLITLDGFLDPESREDSLPFLREIRPTFSGTIIAASTHPDMRELQLHHGCDMAVESKRDIPAKVLEILDLL